jgi:hypothetical protein
MSVGVLTRIQLHKVSYCNTTAVGVSVQLLSTGSSSIIDIRFTVLPVASKNFKVKSKSKGIPVTGRGGL